MGSAKELVEYLLAIRPPNPGRTPIHFNPDTGKHYVDIRKQWARLIEIAARLLGHELEGKKGTFFNFRHTGASHIAQRGNTPAHLLAVVKMMEDTCVRAVNRHYFDIEPEAMQELVLGWKRPDVHIFRRSHRQTFSALSRRRSAARRSLSPASAPPRFAHAAQRHASPPRATQPPPSCR